MPYKDPQKRKEYQRARHQHIRAAAQSITKTLNSALASTSGSQVAFQTASNPALESAQSALALILMSQGVTIPKLVRKVRQRMNSKAVKTIAGEREVVADNDAQLKAVEIAMELQTRAGLLPSDKQHNGAGNITLNVISYHSLEPQIITIEQPTDNTQDN